MRCLAVLFAISFTPFVLLCQENREDIIVSSGNTIISNGGSIDWVIGESFIDHQLLFGYNTEEVPALLDKGAFVVFPTLTHGSVYISTEQEECNGVVVEVYEVSNRKVLSRKWDANPMEINLSDLDDGLYIVRMLSKEKLLSDAFKVVKY